MKKAIAIIILGLLLHGCAGEYTGKKSETRGEIYVGINKLDFCRNNLNWICHKSKDTLNDPNLYYYDSSKGYEVVSSVDSRFYVFKDVTKPVWNTGLFKKGTYGNGTLISMHNSMPDAMKSIENDIAGITKKKEEKKITEKKKKEQEKKKLPKPDDDKVVAASMGSGFFVTSAGHLVTNYHVIEECNAVKTNILGKEVRTDIIAIDKTNDLAIIKAEMNPSKVFPVSNKDVSLLQDVIVAGFPLGKSVSAIIKTHKGSVTALAGFGDNYSNFQTDATINQGNSGGPIMDLKGNVVGVAVQLIAAEHAQNVFFGVKSSTLKTFANANSINFLPPNNREMSNEDLGQLITEATVFLECWMTVAKIKQIIAQEENRKAFYSEHK